MSNFRYVHTVGLFNAKVMHWFEACRSKDHTNCYKSRPMRVLDAS